MNRERPTTDDAMRAILAIAAQHVDVETAGELAAVNEAQRTREARIEKARSARREHVPQGADRFAVSVEEYRPAGAAKHRGELVGTVKRTRMSKSSRAYFDRYLDELRRRGVVDPEARPFTGLQKSAAYNGIENLKLAVREFRPFVQLAIVRAFTTPAREVRALAEAVGYPLKELSEWIRDEDLDRPVWNWRNKSHRKAVALLGGIFGGAEPTTRPGYSHVCAGYSRAAFASLIPNPIEWRDTRRRSIKGNSPKYYNLEAMSCADPDRFGIPRGALPILRLWAAIFDLPLDVHQPDGGQPGIGRYERGTDGRWVYNQYWIRDRFTRYRWSNRARRPITSPMVLEWLGDKVTEADELEWASWLAELEREDRAAPDVAEQLEHIARDFAEAEAAAVDAHGRNDLRAALEASGRAQRLRIMGSSIEPRLAHAAREHALERRGILEASHKLAADLSRRRRRGRRGRPPVPVR